MAIKIVIDVGSKYGQWTVMSESFKKPGRTGYLVRVKCDCGCESAVPPGTLLSGSATMCHSCAVKVRHKPRLSGREVVINANFLSYRKSAKKRGHAFLLSKEGFSELLFNDCFYCGKPPSNQMTERYLDGRVLPKTNGIDRISNHLGYEVENVVTCCRWCNEAKHAKTTTEFLEWISNLSERFGEVYDSLHQRAQT